MKKAITILLAATLMLSLAACGGGNDSNNKPISGDSDTPTTQDDTAEPKAQELTIGETTVDDTFEFTLTRFDTGTVLCNTMNSDFLLPGDYPITFEGADGKTYDNPNVAHDGKIFLSVSFNIKFIGKQELNSTPGEGLSIDYNDEYTFDINRVYMNTGNSWEITVLKSENSTSTYFQSFKPLDSTVYECRGYFEVPMEVIENTEAPIKLKTPSSNGFVYYTIR